jgi:DNA-binding transcriptional regulator YiaG
MKSQGKLRERVAKTKRLSRERTLTLWQRLDLIREREGLSDSQFAEALGMSRQQYSNLKTNDQRLTTAWRIAVEAMDKYGLAFLAVTHH